MKPSEHIKAAARKVFFVVFTGTPDDNLRHLHATNNGILDYLDELEERVRKLEAKAQGKER